VRQEGGAIASSNHQKQPSQGAVGGSLLQFKSYMAANTRTVPRCSSALMSSSVSAWLNRIFLRFAPRKAAWASAGEPPLVGIQALDRWVAGVTGREWMAVVLLPRSPEMSLGPPSKPGTGRL